MLSQIKPQAPLLVVPIRPCLIFMFNVLSALTGFRPRLSQDTVYRKINDRKLFGRMSNSTHAAYLFDGAYSQHMQHSLFTFVLAPLANDFAVVRLETKEGPFYYRNISGEEFIFYYSFK